ncbi:hypothetical protein PYJP_00610 [Pyrofollis japonicus]|nr:hypothetical protein PYJP_00610 [Pyrofollis japonicus]
MPMDSPRDAASKISLTTPSPRTRGEPYAKTNLSLLNLLGEEGFSEPPFGQGALPPELEQIRRSR